MPSKRKSSSSSNHSKVSFDSSSISNQNETLLRGNMAENTYSNNNNSNLKEKPRSWMTSYNAGSHSFVNFSSECDSVKKEISNSNTPRESCALTLKPERSRKKARSSSLEAIFVTQQKLAPLTDCPQYVLRSLYTLPPCV